MQEKLKPAELILGIDVKPREAHQGIDWMKSQAITLAKIAKELGIFCVMSESLVRADYTIIDDIHALGLKFLAELKLCGTRETLATDGILLRRHKPDFVSFMLRNLDIAAIEAFRKELPDTKLLGWTILTNRNDKKFRDRNGYSIGDAAIQLGQVAVDAKMDGLISAPKEAKALWPKFGHKLPFYASAIRPQWATISDDDQDPERTMTTKEAIEAGVSYLIVKRPIIEDKNPREAMVKIQEEMEQANLRYRS